MTRLELIQKVDHFLATNDEAGLELFIRDHYAEFPESLRMNVLWSHVTQALSTMVATNKAIDELRRDTLDALDPLNFAQE